VPKFRVYTNKFMHSCIHGCAGLGLEGLGFEMLGRNAQRLIA